LTRRIRKNSNKSNNDNRSMKCFFFCKRKTMCPKPTDPVWDFSFRGGGGGDGGGGGGKKILAIVIIMATTLTKNRTQMHGPIRLKWMNEWMERKAGLQKNGLPDLWLGAPT